jgi:hypothetical protein
LGAIDWSVDKGEEFTGSVLAKCALRKMMDDGWGPDEMVLALVDFAIPGLFRLLVA